MLNTWNQYQCMATFNLSRSASLYETGIGRGMGFRDSNQDLLGFVHLIPERARQRILDIAATQLSDGTCYHQYQPLTKKGNAEIGGDFYDDHLWLVLSTCAYIKETGDLVHPGRARADTPTKPGQAGENLLHHLETSSPTPCNNRGPHGLPLIGHADWNDCLNLNCFSTEPNESFQTRGGRERFQGGIGHDRGAFPLRRPRDGRPLPVHWQRPADAERMLAGPMLKCSRRSRSRPGTGMVHPGLRRRGQPGGIQSLRGREDLHREPGLVRAGWAGPDNGRARGPGERPSRISTRPTASSCSSRPTAAITWNSARYPATLRA